MMALQRSIDALRREMEAERVEGARFRRTMEVHSRHTCTTI